jgi:molecular chaperone GrpE
MTAEQIDDILARFRTHLHSIADAPEDSAPAPAFDLSTIVAQFTALRHDVNLQTKATRQAIETVSAPAAPSTPAEVMPLLKAFMDIAEQLRTAHQQVEKTIAGLRTVEAAPVGFFARLFGKAPAAPTVDPRLGSLADGYAMSLRRIDATLPQFGLELIPCIGETFDPELMEVLELVPGTGKPKGTVVEEVRRGYRRGGSVIRFAQVKVAG